MIGFLHPWVLAALPLAALPIILHLLKRREPPTVPFPAVRYLRTATEEHQRRFRLQNWLLLLVRSLLIMALILAAAGPGLPLSGVPGHAPTALVVIVDNSASSAAVANGTPRLDAIIGAARTALGRATPDDALWLMTADGVPRRGDAAALARLLDSLAPSAGRLDLGAAVATADALLATDDRPGEILLLTDLQRTAAAAADPRAPLAIGTFGAEPPLNRGIGAIASGAQPWSTDGGRLTLELVGDTGARVPFRARLGDGREREALAVPGAPAQVALPPSPPGWWVASVTLDADELRLDDERVTLIRVAPVARADCAGAGRHVEAACDVLRRNGRLGSGTEVTIGRLGPAASVVVPPADPAELGALNRALARRGVSWSYGTPVLAPAATDSGPLLGAHAIGRRHALTPVGSGLTGVLVTVGGAPWAVRSGNVVLIGSRLEPEWTTLPLAAEFMPFMDRLANRVARGELALVEAAPGVPAPLPDLVSEVRMDTRRWPVDGGGFFAPPGQGVYVLLADADTVGALNVNVDPRESELAPLERSAARDLLGADRVVSLAEAGNVAFSARARGDLRGPLLWLALALGVIEVALAAARRRTA